MTSRKVIDRIEHERWVDNCSLCGAEYNVSERQEDREDGGLCGLCRRKRNAEKCKAENAYLSGAVVVDFITRDGYHDSEVFGLVLRAADGRIFDVCARPNYSEGETADLEIEEQGKEET